MVQMVAVVVGSDYNVEINGFKTIILNGKDLFSGSEETFKTE